MFLQSERSLIVIWKVKNYNYNLKVNFDIVFMLNTALQIFHNVRKALVNLIPYFKPYYQ